MESQTGKDGAALRVVNPIELDEFRPRTGDRTSRDQHPQYTHQLSQETSETLSRSLVRLVPLIFGALLGSLADSVLIGLVAALIISAAFDLSMEDKSLARLLYRRLRKG